MKSFFEEYGFVALASIVVVLLISMASPVGNLIKASTTELVSTCGESTNNFVNNFEVTDLNGPTVNLISFTIEGAHEEWLNGQHQAIDGMTWEQWVESEWNTDNWERQDDRIFKDGFIIYGEYFSNTIQNNHIYVVHPTSGG